MKDTPKEFFENQEKIYCKNFKEKWTQITSEGVVRHDGVADRDGYAIVLRHPDEVVKSVSSIATEIGAAVPSMIYQGSSVHTTLALFKMQRRSAEAQSIDYNLVDRISNRIKNSIIPPGELEYRGVLMNRDTVIAEGYANEDFVNCKNKILESINSLSDNFNLRGPWGGHITLARFLESKPADEVRDLFEVIRETKPYVGHHLPVAIDIAYISVQNEAIEMTTMEQYAL